ncbi:hypothetical protein Trco_006114 [Trichoderma cornu-damae]|uniref:Uncharacterized protein n=1 Tax=Trichoderma cornu-damae TaxID=654480 RepID=A0A9P8QKS1_9HYPO|nr:hypothetical protein Trco_006114 [Trichoderma cornu-damae]
MYPAGPRYGGAGRLLHAAHDHAQVGRLHDHGHALGLQDLEYGIRHVLGQALLDLQPPGEHLGNPRQLGDADHGVVGDVANVHLAGKGDQMMLADRKHIYVFDNDHLVVAFLENRSVHNVPYVLLISLREIQHGVGVSLRGGQKPLPVRVLSDAFEQCLDGPLHSPQPRGFALVVLF